MKKGYHYLFFCAALLLLSAEASAQITGTVNVPNVTYPDLASIVTALNTQGVGAGGATINLTSGFPQTAPVGGYQLGSTVLNASTSATNKLRINGNGNVITAPVGVGTVDGIFFIKGVDYLTIDNLGLAENAANTVAAPAMEYGYAMVNLNGTAPFDGCQNDTIRNCTIVLSRTAGTANNGIFAAHQTSASAIALTITTVADLHSNNRFYSNNISNVIRGFSMTGFAGSPTTALFDQNNDIGGTSAATGNTITNCIGASFTGIGAITTTYNHNINISYNSINSTANGGTPSIGGCWGIYCFGAGATASVTNNSVTTVESSINSTYYQYGIYANASGMNMTITNNIVNLSQITGAGTIPVTCIPIFNPNAQTSTISSNSIIQSQGMSGSATNYGIYASPIVTGSATINANTITQTCNSASGGQFYSIVVLGATGNTTGTEVITNNVFLNTNLSTAGIFGFHMMIHTAGDIGNKTITGNSISGSYQSASTNGVYGVYQLPGTAPQAGTLTINNNNFSGIALSGAGVTCYGIYAAPATAGAQNYAISGNTVSGITATATATLFGIYTTLGNNSNIFQNNIGNLNSTGGIVTGIYAGSNTTNNIYRNKIHTLTSSTATGVVYGLTIAGGNTSQVYNNTVGAFTAPAANNTIDVIRGINLTSTIANSTIGLYYNSIYLNATTTGANFSTSGIYQTISTTATTATADLRNNIIINNSTPTGTGTTAALRRSAANGTNTAATTNRNVYYAGVPAANRLIFTDGTNNYQTLATYQAAATPVDANSFTENSPFASVVGTAANFLHFNPISNTIVESSGTNVAGITNDYDGDIRQGNAGYTSNGTAPDIGADEFNNCGTIAITTQPINDTACSASVADFTIVATNTGLYQWQVSSGAGYTDIVNGGVYSGANTAQLVVTNPPAALNGNTYRVVIRSGPTCGTITSNIARLAVTASPDATVTSSGPLTICAGDTVKLTAPFAGNLTYQWKKGAANIAGATSNELAVDSSGSYTVVVTSTNGCSATSTPKVVVVNPRPNSYITYNSPINFCRGSAVVLNASVSPAITYQWYRNDTPIPGATSAFYSAMDSGAYRVVITNVSNCNRSSPPINVLVYQRPNPIISANGFLLTLNGIYAAYQWRMDNNDISGATGPTYTIAANGTYSVRVIDSNGCENVSPVYYLGNLGMNAFIAAEKGIVTYPNPAAGRLTIENTGAAKMEGIAIYNSIGSLVLTTTPQTTKHTIVLDGFAAGIYTVRIQTSAGTVTRKLEIVR